MSSKVFTRIPQRNRKPTNQRYSKSVVSVQPVTFVVDWSSPAVPPAKRWNPDPISEVTDEEESDSSLPFPTPVGSSRSGHEPHRHPTIQEEITDGEEYEQHGISGNWAGKGGHVKSASEAHESASKTSELTSKASELASEAVKSASKAGESADKADKSADGSSESDEESSEAEGETCKSGRKASDLEGETGCGSSSKRLSKSPYVKKSHRRTDVKRKSAVLNHEASDVVRKRQRFASATGRSAREAAEEGNLIHALKRRSGPGVRNDNDDAKSGGDDQSEVTAGPAEPDVPETGESSVPEADVSNIPEADESDVPEAEESDVPETDVQNVSKADESNMPEADESDVPGADVRDMSKADESDVPEADESDAPGADVRDISKADESDVPEGDESNVPEADELNVPGVGESDGQGRDESGIEADCESDSLPKQGNKTSRRSTISQGIQKSTKKKAHLQCAVEVEEQRRTSDVMGNSLQSGKKSHTPRRDSLKSQNTMDAYLYKNAVENVNRTPALKRKTPAKGGPPTAVPHDSDEETGTLSDQENPSVRRKHMRVSKEVQKTPLSHRKSAPRDLRRLLVKSLNTPHSMAKTSAESQRYPQESRQSMVQLDMSLCLTGNSPTPQTKKATKTKSKKAKKTVKSAAEKREEKRKAPVETRPGADDTTHKENAEVGDNSNNELSLYMWVGSGERRTGARCMDLDVVLSMVEETTSSFRDTLTVHAKRTAVGRFFRSFRQEMTDVIDFVGEIEHQGKSLIKMNKDVVMLKEDLKDAENECKINKRDLVKLQSKLKNRHCASDIKARVSEARIQLQKFRQSVQANSKA